MRSTSTKDTARAKSQRRSAPANERRPAAWSPTVPEAVVWGGMALAALILVLHVRTYTFLTDDSFISFRYARNLVQGYGLVFNPGGERVEGYTNLLWVLLLAGFRAIGLGMERMALVLSFAATAALIVIVVRFVWARVPRGQRWIAVLPALFLACTRSFAVWASSGLETRLFDLLLVAGLLRLVDETESTGENGRSLRPVAPCLFGLASLTRPDGVLVGGCAFLATMAFEWRRTGRIPIQRAFAWWPMAALIGAHLAFRLAYYGYWVPNTFYAKVGSRHSWGAGGLYLTLFALEYGAVLWLPGLIAGTSSYKRKNALFVPILFAAAVVPHALYIAEIGGDHFEFRPLDFYLPLVFLVLAEGIRGWVVSPRRAVQAALYAAAVLFGLTWFPLRSHIQFPRQYWPGFPGTYAGLLPEADRYLAPENDPVFRLWPLRAVAGAYRDLMREQTTHFGGIRQEEHRMFLETANAAAGHINDVLARDALPRDLYVAIDCVGAVPYRTNLRILDRLGLTDAHVAHGPFVSQAVAHGKYATMEYARERGVDIWSADPVSPVLPVGNSRLERGIRRALAEGGDYYSADLGNGNFLFCLFPQGVVRAQERMPRIRLLPVQDSTIVASYIRQVLPPFLADLEAGRANPRRVQRVGELCILAGDLESAGSIYDIASKTYPDNWQFSWMLAICRKMLGDVAGASAPLLRAGDILARSGDPAAPTRLQAIFEQLKPGMSLRGLAANTEPDEGHEEAPPTGRGPRGAP
jgi:hypothetical protein